MSERADVLSVGQVAARYGIARMTVYRLVKREVLRPLPMGGTRALRFCAVAVRSVMERGQDRDCGL